MYSKIVKNILIFLDFKLGNYISHIIYKFFFSRIHIHLVIFNILDLSYNFLIIFTTFFDLGINKIPLVFKIYFNYRNKKKIKVFIMKIILIKSNKSLKILLAEIFFFLYFKNLILKQFISFSLDNCNCNYYKFYFNFNINLSYFTYLNRFIYNYYIKNDFLFYNLTFNLLIINKNLTLMLLKKKKKNFNLNFFFNRLYLVLFSYFLKHK